VNKLSNKQVSESSGSTASDKARSHSKKTHVAPGSKKSGVAVAKSSTANINHGGRADSQNIGNNGRSGTNITLNRQNINFLSNKK